MAMVMAPPPAAALTRVYNEDRRDQLQELALYGEGTWRFAPGWTFAAGARAFRSHLEVKANIGGAPPTAPRVVDERRPVPASRPSCRCNTSSWMGR